MLPTIGLLIAFVVVFGAGFFWVVNMCPLCKQGVMKKVGRGPHDFGSIYSCSNCNHTCYRED